MVDLRPTIEFLFKLVRRGREKKNFRKLAKSNTVQVSETVLYPREALVEGQETFRDESGVNVGRVTVKVTLV